MAAPIPRQRCRRYDWKPRTNAVRSPITPLATRRILIVGDDKNSADSLALELRRLGQYVRISYGAGDALRLARALRPDIVFIDLVVSGLAGSEVARQLRSEPRLQRVLIAALTELLEAQDEGQP